MSQSAAESGARGVCEACGVRSSELMQTSSGKWMCPACCSEQERLVETMAPEMMTEPLASVSEFGRCSSCGAISMSLTSAGDGTKLCERCQKQRAQAPRVPMSAASSSSRPAEPAAVPVAGSLIGTCPMCGGTGLELMATPEGPVVCAECYLEAESMVATEAMSTVIERNSAATSGLTQCGGCGKPVVKVFPSADGELLCVKCLEVLESSRQTIDMRAQPDSTPLCPRCGKQVSELIDRPDGGRLCPDCYLDEELE